MTPTEVHDFLSFAIDSYDFDPARVYLTGLSCGGYALYEYAADVAAMIPIAGDARPAWDRVGCALGEIPICAFIGDADEVVLPDGTIEPMSALENCGDSAAADVNVTINPGVDHNSWDATYDLTAGHDIYAWLLDHQR